MSRYNISAGAESEYEPGSRNRVLRNLLGITRVSLMHGAEESALRAIENSYFESGIATADTRITAVFTCQMHRDWLGHIYEWAGHYRAVDMSKGSFRFPPAWLVPQNMAAFEQGLLAQHTPCRGNTLEEVAKSLAAVHAELLLIHPFREGNGRLARWLADLMAAQAGAPLPDYAFSGSGSAQRRKSYLEAVLRGYARDYAALSRFFAEALERGASLG